MVSGAPLLTTNLPPRYAKGDHPRILLFKEEAVDGYAKVIRSTLSHPEKKIVFLLDEKLANLFC